MRFIKGLVVAALLGAFAIPGRADDDAKFEDDYVSLFNGELLENMKVPTANKQGIGLQAEVGKFEFRRLRIKEMP